MERTDVVFRSSGLDCSAWLYRPDGEGPHPVVVMGHGFSAVRDQRLDAYAERFAGAGMGVLLFDYRFFGSSAGQPRQLLDIKAQLDDWRSAIAFARELPWADRSRVALFGSSFSGGHVVTIAAEDHSIAAVIAQCPFQDGIATVRAIGARASGRLTWHALIDQLGHMVGRPPHYIPAVAAPGGLAAMSTPDAQAGVDAITPAGTTWENRVAARIGLRVALYRPGKKAGSVACPILWCIADHDTLCPADVTARLATAAPRGEIKRYPCGHFDIYVGDMWQQAVADQVEFLARHLLQSSETAGSRQSG